VVDLPFDITKLSLPFPKDYSPEYVEITIYWKKQINSK
jgi:hypothetical protein